MKAKDAQRLRHIIEEAEDIALFIANGEQDKKTIKAILRSIEVMGEAARHLSPEFKEAYPHVPWQDMTNMRNFVMHEYFRVDERLVWQMAAHDVPELKENIVYILQSLEG